METVIVYSLVVLFFVLLVVFTVAVLSGQPYVAPQQSATAQEHAVEAGGRGAYGAVAILFLLLFVLTFLGQRRQAHAGAS